MSKILETVKAMVTELNSTNGNNEKMEILAKYPDMQKVLEYVYNPYKQYGVTSKNLLKRAEICDTDNPFTDLFGMLDNLESRVVTGHDAIGRVNGFIHGNMEYNEEIFNILDKDLKIRMGISLINKVFPELIPEFKVALANKYQDYENKVDFEKEIWYASRKLDGVRVITIVDEKGDVKFYSRTGNEFVSLDKVKADTVSSGVTSIVLDGEMCVVDEDGNEDFTAAVSQVKRKSVTMERPKYKVFDILTLDEFNSRTSTSTFGERLMRGAEIFDCGIKTIEHVSQRRVRSKEHLSELMAEATKNGWEGLIIRKEGTYEGKRTKNMLKVKKMHDAEYIVIDIESGPFRIISKETGLEIQEDMLSAVHIEHKGNTVGVGSGFSIEERQKYHKNPEMIIGKEITVQYFEESCDKDGNPSLRFPVVKHIFENGRDV